MEPEQMVDHDELASMGLTELRELAKEARAYADALLEQATEFVFERLEAKTCSRALLIAELKGAFPAFGTNDAIAVLAAIKRGGRAKPYLGPESQEWWRLEYLAPRRKV